MAQDRFANEKYMSWITVQLSLHYAKEGLEPTTEDRVKTFHSKLKSKLPCPSSSSVPAAPALCHACEKQDLKKQWGKRSFSCVNGICNGWLDLLQKEHTLLTSKYAPKLEWSNFDVSLLPASPWECAKVYLPHGSQHVQCAGDADLAALLTLYLNCQHVASLHDVSLCRKVKEVRNKLIHTGTMEIDTAQMMTDVGLIKKLLNDPAFATDQACQVAVTKIDELLEGKLELSLNKELELQVLNRHIKSLYDRTDQMSQDLSDLTDEVQLLDSVKTEVSGLGTDVTSLRDQQLKAIKDIKQLQNTADLFSRFINDFHIDKLDLKQLADSISQLSTLRDKAETQGQILTRLQETVGRHETTLEQHGKEIGQLKEQMSQQQNTIPRVLAAKSALAIRVDALGEDLGAELSLETREKLKRRMKELEDGKAPSSQPNQEIDVACPRDEAGAAQTTEADSSTVTGATVAPPTIVNVGGQGAINVFPGGQMNIGPGSNIIMKSCSTPSTPSIPALQTYLIDIYQQYCEWENPVTADEQVIISKMYANPAVKLLREKDENRALVEVRKRLKENEPMPLSYRQVFLTKTEQCKNIYITGDAGMGKTAFCKQLIHSWCKAVHSTADGENLDEDLNVLKEFTLLFYINLRDVDSKYHIEDMIRENVLHSFSRDLNAPGHIEHILKTQKCLVVLDGLDEWTCPKDANICPGLNKEIPGRDMLMKNCVFLTTSRNWKFDVIDYKTKEVDKHVELCGIDEKSLQEFAEKFIGHLDSNCQSERPISVFFKEVEEKKLDSVTNIPIIFTQLLTLWWFCKDLGKSQVKLYCGMLDLLFERARKHLPEKTSTVSMSEQTETELPECFSEEDSCKNHAQLILCLSKLAFMSLLNKKKENSLVFKSSKLEIYDIKESDISLCLKCGILTQSKVLGNPTGRFKKYSFLHKKLQEFLAALYLVTQDGIDGNMSQLKAYCDKVDTTLEMGQVLMFACGIKASVGIQLLNHLMSVVSTDTRVHSSRQCRTATHRDLIQNIQSCLFSCLAEGASNEITYYVLLEDCWIERCNISDVVKHVVGLKNNSIKSVYLNTNKCTKELLSEVLNHLQSETNGLEKLLIWDDNLAVDDSIVTSVVKNNTQALKSLVLHNVGLGSDALFSSVMSCIPSLQSLGLGQGLGLGFETEELKKLDESEKLDKMKKNLKASFPVARVTHAQIEQLLSAQTDHLKQLQIQLYCIEHGGDCRPVLDLSTHTQLQSISFWWVCLKDLHAVSQSIKRVVLTDVSISHSDMKQFIEALAQTSQKVSVEMWYITIEEDSENPVDLVAYLRGCDKFNVTKCDITRDNIWSLLKFHKK